MKKQSNIPVDVETYSVEQVMEIWGIGRTKVYKLMSEGKLHYRQILGTRKFTAQDLREYLENVSSKNIRTISLQASA